MDGVGLIRIESHEDERTKGWMMMRNVFPVKFYKDEGFVEYKIEINDEDLEVIIEDYLMAHAEFDFDDMELVNNRPMNSWFYAKCRRYVDPDGTEEERSEQIRDAEVEVSGAYEDISTGGLSL